MIDLMSYNGPSDGLQVFCGKAPLVGTYWETWRKPRGCSMLQLTLVGKGGHGGTGVVGANSTAAGGGGGASGSVTVVTIPFVMIPDVLYLSLQGITTTETGAPSVVTVTPANVAANTLAYATSGGNGGAGAGATPGAAGTAGAAATAAQMPLGFPFAVVSAGSAGGAGSASGNVADYTYSGPGKSFGGLGGAGLGAAGSTGGNGGGLAAFGLLFNAIPGGPGAVTATTPPGNGSGGTYLPTAGLFLPGFGGGATHGTATGAGLVQSLGGDGGWGAGGGGGGGALTGSTAANPYANNTSGRGGPAYAIFLCW